MFGAEEAECLRGLLEFFFGLCAFDGKEEADVRGCWLWVVAVIGLVWLVWFVGWFGCGWLSFPAEEWEREFCDDGEVAECSCGDGVVGGAVLVSVLTELFDAL